MERTAVRCSCGQRIGQKQVLHEGFYPRPFGPSYVLVRYRCGRCRKKGQQFLTQAEWESGILREQALEASAAEKSRFALLGPIQPTEQVSFHHELEALTDLSELVAEFDSGSSTPDE